MTDERGHPGQGGRGDPDGRHGQAGDRQRDPWAPPEEGVRLNKTEPSVSDEPTVSALPGAGGGPAAAPPHAGVPPAYGPGAPNPYGPPAAPTPYPSAQYGHPAAPQPSGYPYPGYARPAMPGAPWMGGPPLPSGTSTASMVLGIIGLVLMMTCYGSLLGIFVAPVAMGLGISARRKVAAGIQGGSGQANAGFIMGIVGTVLSVLIAVLLVIVFVAALNSDPYDDPYVTDDPSYSHSAHGSADRTVTLEDGPLRIQDGSAAQAR